MKTKRSRMCFLHILPRSYTLLGLDMLAPLSYICSLQLLLMSQSLHFANQRRHFLRCPCLANELWQGAKRGCWAACRVRPPFTVSSSTLYARVIPLQHLWLQRQICVQFTYSRKNIVLSRLHLQQLN